MALGSADSAAANGTARVAIGLVAMVALLFAAMYASSPTVAEFPVARQPPAAISEPAVPPPSPPTVVDPPPKAASSTPEPQPATPTTTAGSEASPAPAAGGLTWLRGTGGRVQHASACTPVPSLGFWRVRCGAMCAVDGQARRSASLRLANDALTLKTARCSGPGCTGEPSLTVTKGTDAGVWRIDFGPCSDADVPAAPTPLRDADVTFDVAVADEAGAPTLAQTRTCFLSIGDWGRDSANQRSVAIGMTSVAAADAGVRFVVSTGDNFYPTGVKGVTDPHFNKTFETPFASPEMREMLWLISAGNHDQWGITGQVQYSLTAAPLTETRLPRSERWYFPKPVYAMEVPVSPRRSARFVVLNSYGRNTPATLKFLQSEMEEALRGGVRGNDAARKAKLAANGAVEKVPVPLAWEGGKEEWRIIINHAPLWSGSRHGQERKETPPVRKLIRPAVDSVKAHGYFSGHDHVLEVHRDVGTDYFVSGGGGGSKTDKSIQLATTKYYRAGGDVGFMRHCFVGDEMKTTVFATSGKAPEEAPKEVFEYTTPIAYAAGEAHEEDPNPPPKPT